MFGALQNRFPYRDFSCYKHGLNRDNYGSTRVDTMLSLLIRKCSLNNYYGSAVGYAPTSCSVHSCLNLARPVLFQAIFLFRILY